MALEHDAQLMLRVKEGDDSSFAELLERYRKPVIHFVYRMVQNQSVAEELSQDVFLRVYRARKAYEPSARFTTWLFSIASNIALNAIRDSRAERLVDSMDGDEYAGPEVADRHRTVEQALIEEARLAEVRRAVLHLPAKQRAAVLMHKYEELDYGQIARALECSESAVKSLLFRAYETLRSRLAHVAPAAAR